MCSVAASQAMDYAYGAAAPCQPGYGQQTGAAAMQGEAAARNAYEAGLRQGAMAAHQRAITQAAPTAAGPLLAAAPPPPVGTTAGCAVPAQQASFTLTQATGYGDAMLPTPTATGHVSQVPAAFASQQQPCILEAAAHQAGFEAAWAAQAHQQQQQQQELLNQQHQQLGQQQAQLQQQMQHVQLLHQQVQQQMQHVQVQGHSLGRTVSERHVYGGLSPSEQALAAAQLGAPGGLTALQPIGASQSYLAALPQGVPARGSVGGTMRAKKRGCIC